MDKVLMKEIEAEKNEAEEIVFDKWVRMDTMQMCPVCQTLFNSEWEGQMYDFGNFAKFCPECGMQLKKRRKG